jgi:hypothetical protein
MRKFLLAITATALCATAVLAQHPNPEIAGRGAMNPAGSGPEDRASEPSPIDRIILGVRADSVEKSAAAARAKQARARPAKPSEITAGSTVNDPSGDRLATIEGVAPDGAVLFNGSARVKVPLDAFGHNRKGLLLDMSKTQFDDLVAAANVPSGS